MEGHCNNYTVVIFIGESCKGIWLITGLLSVLDLRRVLSSVLQQNLNWASLAGRFGYYSAQQSDLLINSGSSTLTFVSLFFRKPKFT